MAKNNEPDSVEHDQTNLLPIPDSVATVGPQIHTTTVHEGENTYTGSGWTEKGSQAPRWCQEDEAVWRIARLL